MTDNEFLLQDRITKIKSMDEQYDLNTNSFINFSGGKDSTVLSHLIDMALPNNTIPRVYCNTQIEFNSVVSFVRKLKEKDNRIIEISQHNNIREILETYGYPFKSKMHSNYVLTYNKAGMLQGIHNYLHDQDANKELKVKCPQKLKFQFTSENKLKISDLCCNYMKEMPLKEWAEQNNKTISIIGIMTDDGGIRRASAKCWTFNRGAQKFQPLVAVTKDWEEWFIKKYNIELCELYYEPFNFGRTGCKGCPFTLHLQEVLDVLQQYFPNERKQCELIWKPVYTEYRRLNYRLKPINPSLF